MPRGVQWYSHLDRRVGFFGIVGANAQTVVLWKCFDFAEIVYEREWIWTNWALP